MEMKKEFKADFLEVAVVGGGMMSTSTLSWL